LRSWIRYEAPTDNTFSVFPFCHKRRMLNDNSFEFTLQRRIKLLFELVLFLAAALIEPISLGSVVPSAPQKWVPITIAFSILRNQPANTLRRLLKRFSFIPYLD